MSHRIIVLFLLSVPAAGQTFEVASVKVAPPEPPGQTTMGYPGLCPAIRYTNLCMLDLLADAYQVKQYQISGPSWFKERQPRYVIGATCPAKSSPAEIRKMLQALLAERFHLVAHLEKKEQPVYALIVPNGGGSKLVKVRESGTGGFSEGSSGPGGVKGKFTLADLAALLSYQTDRPILDKTGLDGMFEIDLHWIRDSDDSSALFSAVKEQMGLRLVPEKASIDLLVIDRVDRTPVEN
ncbi:MAG TPA: TIGR03435 family protein [Bryobacteraceae bacterium]|nr:TIGR03435 family protein [Bryobacteraceae bacterium]